MWTVKFFFGGGEASNRESDHCFISKLVTVVKIELWLRYPPLIAARLPSVTPVAINSRQRVAVARVPKLGESRVKKSRNAPATRESYSTPFSVWHGTASSTRVLLCRERIFFLLFSPTSNRYNHFRHETNLFAVIVLHSNLSYRSSFLSTAANASWKLHSRDNLRFHGRF